MNLLKITEKESRLFTNGADDEVKDNRGVDGHGFAAPARTENAEVAPVDVEGGLESGKVADSGHHADADRLYGHGNAFRYTVDGEVAFDVVGFFARYDNARAAEGKRGEFLDVKEIIGAQDFVASRAARVQAGGLHRQVDFAFLGILRAVGQRAAEFLKYSFFFEDHPFRRGER